MEQPAGSFGSFENAEPVVVGGAWNIDKLRWFTGCDYTITTQFLQGFSPRTADSGELVLGMGKASVVLFMCNEGTGTTITDARAGKVGTFSGQVGWHNLWWDWDKNGLQKIISY